MLKIKPNAGSRRQRTRANIVEEALRKHLPDFAIPHFDRAINGEVAALRKLLVAAPDDLRGSIALLFYLRQAEPPIIQCVVEDVWLNNHAELIRVAGTRTMLKAMFEAAQFELPRAMPEAVQIWRGTRGSTAKVAANGYSWTTDRDVACWFAMRRPERQGSPLVLTAHVKRADIAFLPDERNECEVLIFGPPNSEIDGTEQGWQQGLNEFEAAKNARQRAWMKVLPTIGSTAEQSR
jgi:hypothetical protein